MLRRGLLAAVATLAAISACGDDGGLLPGGDPADAAPPAEAGTSTDGAAEPPDASDSAAEPIYGLDERPPNTTCSAPARPPAGPLAARWERVFTSVPLPDNTVDLFELGEAFYVVHRPGRLLRFEAKPGAAAYTVAFDISSAVDDVFEGGLLSVVPHPKFAQNGYVFAYYTRKDASDTFFIRVSRFTSSDGGLTFDPLTEKVVLEYVSREFGHTGGRLLFGPDGYLYFSTGDSFFPRDSQLTDDLPCSEPTPCPLHGKILRLDVDGGDPYAIPPSNPFAGGGGRKEIYAWGFRNPFRMSFDRATGDLFVVDVGALDWEEVSRVELGGNYGWPRAEGFHCHDENGCAGLVEPILAVPNTLSAGCPDATTCARALVGGVIYRGSAIPEAHGAYFFGDQSAGHQFVARADPVTGALVRTTLNPAGPPIRVTGYTEDAAGEAYLIDYFGAVFKLVRDGSEPAVSSFPTKLSATGCVDPDDPTKPAAGVIPYAINVPSWSDGADAEHFFAIPDGTTITVLPDGDLDLPVGSVTMQTFRLGEKRVETRLFVRHDDGWAGYSYEWQDDQKDAILLSGGKVKTVSGQTWVFPSRAECLHCHTGAAQGTLGLEISQMNRLADYPGRPARDQLGTLASAGFFAPGTVLASTPLPRLDGPEPVMARARAMLHVRCSSCHRPGGNTPAGMDLRFGTALGQTGTCGIAPARGDMGVAGARLLAPGAPEQSLLLRRMSASDAWRMPPIASRRVDVDGAKLLSEMIQSLGSCP